MIFEYLFSWICSRRKDRLLKLRLLLRLEMTKFFVIKIVSSSFVMVTRMR